MPLLATDLSQRALQPEVMDDPSLDRMRHEAALRGLERINRVSRTAAGVWAMIRPQAMSSPQPLRVLDVATGAGDVPLELCRLARREDVALRIAACDRSMVAIEHARCRAMAAHQDVNFIAADALRDPLPCADVVTSCLFLHHLDESEASGLLQRLGQHADRVIVDDLERSRVGLMLAWAGTRILTRCDVVHEDGPQSVRAAFSLAEVRALAERAGLHGAVLRRRWPCRFTLDWRRP